MSQFHSITEIESAMAVVVGCFEYVWFALKANRIAFLYDDSIEMRGLHAGGTLLAADLNHISDRDLKNKWLIYTRNHSKRALSDQCAVTVSAPEAEPFVDGLVRDEIVDSSVKWFSFALPVDAGGELIVCKVGGTPLRVSHASTQDVFTQWWPKYEASKKHGEEGYYRDGGKYVSAMALDPATAQAVLMASVEVNGQRYGIYEEKYYRFPRTMVGQEIFHGFEISKSDVPPEAVAALIDISIW